MRFITLLLLTHALDAPTFLELEWIDFVWMFIASSIHSMEMDVSRMIDIIIILYHRIVDGEVYNAHAVTAVHDTFSTWIINAATIRRLSWIWKMLRNLPYSRMQHIHSFHSNMPWNANDAHYWISIETKRLHTRSFRHTNSKRTEREREEKAMK